MGFLSIGAGTTTTVPKSPIDDGASRQGASLHSSKSKSDSDENPKNTVAHEISSRQGALLNSNESEVDSNENVQLDEWNNSGPTSPPVSRAESPTCQQFTPERVSMTAVASLEEDSRKPAVTASARNQTNAPSFLLGIDDAINAMMTEMNRAEVEEESSD
ncbi:unnamed protein product [Cylindrotheca closterium]|uniref:Uncharacterized protein n=1 Tax=Cylindrotheca closterium TaxID=2856 RepID=A0AAD2GD56_9STRA|nr:unnamed protein product [Cylindrotheca closterium]